MPLGSEDFSQSPYLVPLPHTWTKHCFNQINKLIKKEPVLNAIYSKCKWQNVLYLSTINVFSIDDLIFAANKKLFQQYLLTHTAYIHCFSGKKIIKYLIFSGTAATTIYSHKLK